MEPPAVPERLELAFVLQALICRVSVREICEIGRAGFGDARRRGAERWAPSRSLAWWRLVTQAVSCSVPCAWQDRTRMVAGWLAAPVQQALSRSVPGAWRDRTRMVAGWLAALLQLTRRRSVERAPRDRIDLGVVRASSLIRSRAGLVAGRVRAAPAGRSGGWASAG